ncbi:IAP-5 [Choristoneura occidentalis granulovirus]|uniref:IAP-5 n=1 Tax=Choristoneura occidentalis granulovirus TaxID=364745 RepID=Q1A4K1_9BBAC|nr:IAP-5 [Choristoneura fumiferana granulovirus]ABC61229.1 IAP-5 [Choristoneura fumiferana granulovirus]
MESYVNRLDSFKDWTGNEDKEKLALVGFYYTGYKDIIICYYCKYDDYNYNTGDEDTLTNHKRYSPDCPFYLTNTDKYVNTKFLSPRIISNNYPNLAPCKGDYTLSEHRINSFINFPKIIKPLIKQLCDAGFYYTNTGDAVCCYACNVIAKDFDLNSDVWKIHKNLNYKCPLMILQKIAHNNNYNVSPNQVLPTAPFYENSHYSIPKCLGCRHKFIDAVMLPCYHFCMCQECAITCTQCKACNVFTGGFFAVKIPIDKLNLIEHERFENRV